MRRLIVCINLVMILATDAALAERWYTLYNQALYDLEAGRWQPAIAKLQEAVKQNPKSGQSIRVEAKRTVRYFPYFFLGKAYFHLSEYEEASKFFAMEGRHTLPENVRSEIARYQEQIWASVERKRRAEFERALKQVEAARKNGLFGQAAEQLQGARQLDAAEFEKRGLGKLLVSLRESEKKRLAEHEQQKSEAFQNLMTQASEKEKQGALGQASVLLQQADKLTPGRPEVETLRVRIKEREDRYASLRQGSSLDEREGRLNEALEKLRQAEQVHPERAKAENLGEGLGSLSRRVEIQQLLSAAAQAVEHGQYRHAVESYERVLTLDPEYHAARELKERARSLALTQRAGELAREGSFTEALDAFELALNTHPNNGEVVYDEMRLHFRTLTSRRNSLLNDWLGVMRSADPASFEKERLLTQASTPRSSSPARRSSSRAKRAAEEDKPAQALTALQVHPEEAVRILEKERATRKTGSAELESWTGVAYARLSLLTVDPRKKEELRAKAAHHFRVARRINPKYRLNSRVVPPRIMQLFETAQKAE